MKHLVIFGAPGSGKGTQAKLINKYSNITHISVGQILRQAIKDNHPLSKKLQKKMFKGDLVSDKIVNKIIEDNIKDKDENFIFDGYPRNLKQAKHLDEIIGRFNIKCLNLIVSKKEVIKRLSLRGRSDDEEKNVKRRWKTYKRNTKPLLSYYKKSKRLLEVNGEGDIEEISNEIKKILSS
jgi:adenylate kinase